MGLIKGNSSYLKFDVVGELPDNIKDYVVDRVASFSFHDIDETFEEFSIGWVSITDMFEEPTEANAIVAYNCLVLSLRIDERKVSRKVLNKFVRKEEARVKKEKQIPKIPRAMKIEIKERITVELRRKAVPTPTVVDVCWMISENGWVMFFNTNVRLTALFEDFFKDCFGFTLRQQIPYTMGEGYVDVKGLEMMQPVIFV